MKKRIKHIVIIIFALVFIQILTYYLYGIKSISYQYFDKIENHNYHKGIIGVFDNKISKLDKAEIEFRLLKRYKSVQFTSDINEYENKYRMNENNWGLSYEIKHSFPFIATITEENGTLYYGEKWESKFIWCFGFWIQYKHLCIGQS